MQKIDLSNWKRRAHFEFFSRMDYPHFNICFDINITNLLTVVKREKIPFYYTMIYLATVSADEIEEFRYRIRDGKVVLHDCLNPAFTDMEKDSDLFKMVTVEKGSDLKEFVRSAKAKSVSQKEYFIASDFIGRDDYIYFTSIPWISFTHISHTISLNKNDAVPRISWGKYYEKDNEIWLPFSVQVNHAFADGIHIARYKETLENNIKNISVK